MENKNAIEVRNISKSFIIKIKESENSSKSRKRIKKIKNLVLNDISFDIHKGEVVGILGRNGSGKSTLLSILSKIMEPDSGTVLSSGKIASILELGMGFHQDMSGRDNIYLKGELYGFSKKELDLKVEKIIQYSGIGLYIDNPVRTYSSGMSGRLAFSIMVNVDSEIMLIDEVLSVGDASFSNKAKQHFKKMSNSGKTVVIVSHNISAIVEMCTRVLWIENGKIKMDGPAKTVCQEYQKAMNESPEIIFDLATEGVPESQYRLALMYRDGIIVEKNNEMYEEWVKRSALQGYVKAQVEYADLLLAQGKEVDAKEFYNDAAERGDNEAKMKIASLNITKDSETSKLLNTYEGIVSSGNSLIEYRYAMLLLKTAWTNDDRKKAFEMFNRSAIHGNANAMYQIALMYRDGLGVERNIEKMENNLINSANRCFLPAIKLLSDYYTDGLLLTKNDDKALQWTIVASELGEIQYMYRLANFYKGGIGTEKNISKANIWYKKYQQASLYFEKILAADTMVGKEIDADTSVEELYAVSLLGYDIKKISNLLAIQKMSGSPSEETLQKIILLASYNNLEAIRYLGKLYTDGIFVKKDLKEAYLNYCKGVSFGDPWCMRSLGEMYRDGIYVEKNINEAIRLFLMAADGGRLECFTIVFDLIASEKENKELRNQIITSLEKYARTGNINAMKQLIYIYSKYNDANDNSDKIQYWKNIGAQLGFKI